MYKIKCTSEFGRGLYAVKNIGAGEIITECELLVLNVVDSAKMYETDLQYYTFKYNSMQDCLVLGDGEIFNHADAPNVEYRLVEYDGRHVMQFYAITDIKAGDQLFIDYTHDCKDTDATAYNVNLTG